MGSSQYSNMPFNSFSDAAFIALLIFSILTFFFTNATKSVTEPLATGTRIAMPSSFPLSSGITSPMALAAPVVVGIIFMAAALALLKSLCIKSATFWSFV